MSETGSKERAVMGVGIACPVETGFMGRYEVGIFPSNPSNHYSNITDYITTKSKM